MTALILVGFSDLALFYAATDPNAGVGWNQLAQLGVIALAVITGAGLYHRFIMMPERARADKERAELIALANRERDDRQKSEERERESAKVALPALQESSRAMDSVLRALERGRTSP